MTSRRSFLSATALAAAAAALHPLPAFASAPSAAGMTRRAIPSTGETIPVIGMGTSGSFEVDAAGREPLKEVLRRFVAGGASVIDTSPNYGNAEDVLGDLMAELGIRDRIWLATKLAADNRAAGEAQFAASLRRLRTDKVELLAVHNLRDWKTQLAFARELKAQGKTKYVGLTHYVDGKHDELADIMAAEKPDFIQINYSVSTTNADRRLLPLAKDTGVAVMINRAFDDGRLFSLVGDRPLPGWAAEAGVTSWAQMFLRFVTSHPAVTVVIPATGKPDRQSDNLKAGVGRDLSPAERAELAAMFA
ncbi:aldo/keto reductase [Arenimonas terrae]|jgi:diketogulonate reductase-like aldo/keto reductase|uniref:Aldo/keto reductase n=1 Tax=Arenimonas terrae TaxID=2546226 RepID=A0A5C4RX04_9GAMM|nr:aldo/keto reductase [Arenimonas terrae]TNJ35237.1 aldo/keto reductase [Arenimonas terrae]